MNFTLYAKSAFDIEQLKAKTAAGCDGIEYQMKGKDVDTPNEELLELLNQYPAKVIHLPMTDCNIESCDQKLLRKVFYLASSCGASVLAHNDLHINQVSPYQLSCLLDLVEDLFSRYSNVDLIIENPSPLHHLSKGSYLGCGGYFDSPSLFAKRINGYTATKRVTTCLDLCHALLADKYLSPINAEIGNDVDFSLRSFIETNKEVLGLIHLAGYFNSGYGVVDHGVLINSDSADKQDKRNFENAKELLSLLKEYNIDIPLTLEVAEEDYNNPTSYIATKKSVKIIEQML